jgi:hypothetical protein
VRARCFRGTKINQLFFASAAFGLKMDCLEGVLLHALLLAHADLALSAQAALSLQHFSPANTGIAAKAANAKQTISFFIGFLDATYLALHFKQSLQRIRRAAKNIVQS